MNLGRINYKHLFIGIGITVLFLFGYFKNSDARNPSFNKTSTTIPKTFKGGMKFSPLHEFWNTTIGLMHKYEPKFSVKAPILVVDHLESIPGVRTKEALLSRSRIGQDVIRELKDKHRGIVENLPSYIPYDKGSNGIIFIGGGKFSWLSYVSLMALRDIGSKLPVEIIMPTYADYEEEINFCTRVLPILNAACVVIPEILGPGAMIQQSNKEKFKSYQFKSLALMVSSFQNVLLLDSDNVPLVNPDSIFDSPVYKKYGMITWPDYWERTTSPVFYEVAGLHVDETKRVKYNQYPITQKQPAAGEKAEEETIPYHDYEGTMQNPSTESGQFMINKKTHSRTLLLSMYYNLYGPTLYYKLLSLGEPGEGDKDTFVAAAHVLGEKYYQVNTKVRALGFFDKGDFHGVAMMHRDPVADFNDFEKFVKPSEYKYKSTQEQISFVKEIDDKYFLPNNILPYYFMHCNFPKLDPLVLMSHDVLYDEVTNRLRYKMYSDYSYEIIDKDLRKKDNLKTADFELQQWKNMHKTLCVDRTYFSHFKEYDTDQLCGFITNQYTWLSEDASNKKINS